MNQKVFDYSELRGEIKKKFSTEAEFARKIGLHPTTLSSIFSKGGCFKTKTIAKIVEVLIIPDEMVCKIFLHQNT